MKHLNCRRILSLVLALVMVIGLLPISVADAVNEAYEARESLAPVGTAFNIDTLLAWTPETDPDAAYSRASIPLQDRQGGFVVNELANPEAKLMLCAMNDSPTAQGSDSFFSYAFNYWQYTDTFIYWGGNGDSTEAGFIQAPTGELIDAAHTNGVPIVGLLGFPWGGGAGYVEQVSDFCQRNPDGTFPVADKLIEVMDYYGFDGWFFNQESYGCNAEIAGRLNEMMRYMHKLRPDILISWYDSMITSGGVSYQDAVNDYNKGWMEADEDGYWGVDEFFMNYNWTTSKINTTISTMKSIGRSQFDAFAGFNVQANVYGDRLRDYQLVDEDGLAKVSLALFYSNQTQMLASDGEEFHKTEQAYYVNAAGDPRVNNVDVTDSTVTEWAGLSRFFADKTPVDSAPFVTDFNTGHGKAYFVDGEKLRDGEWSYQSNQDVLPTYTWIIDSEGSKLEGSYDFEDAYNGGSSVKFSGDLDADNRIMLYSTNVDIENGMSLNLTAKGGLEQASLVAYLGDGSTDSYEACEQVVTALHSGDGWVETSVDLSAYAGKTLYGIGLKVESDQAVSGYQLNLGRLSILDKSRAALSGPKTVKLDDILYIDPYTAEARIQWSKVTGASSYEIYKVAADGSKTFIMETPNTAYYIPSLVRDEDETDVTLEIVPINRNGVRGTGAELVIDWAYGNDDGERYEVAESVNVCLGATVTGYSEQGDGAECDKALDGISGNSSKWWASGVGDWFSIDLGEEKSVRRIRMEHAESGGEGKELNTSAYTIYYKDASGNWVEALKVTGNTDAVNDILLDEPVTAREWKLVINGIGPSPWSAVNIYEWQMFETGYADTKPVAMHFASAINGVGAADTFTLKNVPETRTVKVYNAEGTLLGEQEGSGTVTLTGLDFGTADAGKVYYTATETGYGESVKFSASFEAETAEKSEPATDVAYVEFSQPGSVSSNHGSNIYVTMTVNGLNEGDVVYVYEDGPDAAATRVSQPVAAGETSVSIDRVLVPRSWGDVYLQVKRVGCLISDVYSVDGPLMYEPTAAIRVYAVNEDGETLTGVRFDVLVNGTEEVISQLSTTSDSGASCGLTLGEYIIRNTESPEGYGLAEDIVIDMRIEGWTATYTVVIPAESEEPDPTDPVDPDPIDPTDPAVDPSDDSRDIPVEVLTATAGDWQTGYEATEGPAELVLDNNTGTIWHTDWYGTSRANHWIQFELSEDYNVDGLRYLPRQTGNTNGTITEYDIQVSDDGETFRSVATGNWEDDRNWKIARFDGEHVKYVRLVAVDAVTDNAYVFASAAEIRLTGEVYVEFDPTVNRALNADIVAYNGNALSDENAGPAKLFDGGVTDPDTDKWCENGKDLWVAFDICGTYDVSQIKIYHAGAADEWEPSPDTINTEAYELYVLNTDVVDIDTLLAMSFEERTTLLADNANWIELAAVTGNHEDITTHDVALTDARIFKFNVSDTDSINTWGDCVRVYEVEIFATGGEASHKHVFGEWTVTTEPTCTEAGVETRSCGCGKSETREIPATGHTEEVIPAVPATCTETGLTEGKKCDLCDEILVAQEEIPALGHTEEVLPAVEATCTEEGLTEGKKCSVCDEILVAQEVVPALGHTEEVLPAVEATCTEDGLTEGKKCSVCGEITVAQEVIPALGHDFVNGECSRCDAVKDAPFVDVPVGSFYFDPVEWAVENGITTGVDANHFNPNGQCQRAVVVTFLWRAAGSPEPTSTVNPFTDVKETDFFYKAVLWAVEKGITNGLTATTFGPYALCNRAQVVTFLWRAQGQPAPTTTENPFTDVVITEWYGNAVLWAVENGITNGMGDGTFGVGGICNRAQVVTFLYRAMVK